MFNPKVLAYFRLKNRSIFLYIQGSTVDILVFFIDFRLNIQDMTEYFNRTLEPRLKKALKQFPVCLITGPRQAGKSTLLQNAMPEYKYVTLDDPLNKQLALEDAELFLSQYQGPLIVDEIQNAPNLFPYIKMLVDKDRRNMGRFVLTGSQTFQLMEGVNESLAGRVAIFQLYPFSWEEIDATEDALVGSKSDPRCFSQILKGFYPEFLINPDLDPNLWHGSYISTYLERDVRKIRFISDLGRFQTFIGLLAVRAGNLLNISEVSKECGISQATAKDWISILESTYVIYLLRPYHNNISKRLVKSPKLYFVDTGVLSYLLGIDTAERLIRSPSRGALFENMVIMEVIKRLSYREAHFQCSFYRTTSGVEVDLICEVQEKLLAYEIKFSKTLSKNMTKGLSLFKKDFPKSELKVLSLYPEEVALSRDVKASHWSEFE